MVDNRLQPIMGYMDTGARVSIMSVSTASELKLDYCNEPPMDLKPVGGVKMKAIGFVPQVPLKTKCGQCELEDFYIVADHQMPENKDAYLGLDLVVRRFKHLIRLDCRKCNR